MSDPITTPHPAPGVPPPPPKLNTRRLWITLLAPSGVMVFVMIALFFASEHLSGPSSQAIFTSLCVIVCITLAAAWGFFIHTIIQRFQGTSLVLLTLAYPILQGILIFGIFFAGCLAIVSARGGF